MSQAEPEPEKHALSFLQDHAYAPFARAAISFVAFVLALYGSFLADFAPPSSTGENESGLLFLGALVIALVIAFYAKASRDWPRVLWWLLGLSLILLIASGIAYTTARNHHVEAYKNTEVYFIKGDVMLPEQRIRCGNASASNCLFEFTNTLSVEELYGSAAIEDAKNKLLSRYLMFGLSFFLTLATVFEALVWNHARQEKLAARRKRAKPETPPRTTD